MTCCMRWPPGRLLQVFSNRRLASISTGVTAL